MPILNDKEYRCDCCGNIYDLIRNDEWNMDKAMKEFDETFPGQSKENMEVVCDDCWEIVKPKDVKSGIDS